jgi:hypothetical protein
MKKNKSGGIARLPEATRKFVGAGTPTYYCHIETLNATLNVPFAIAGFLNHWPVAGFSVSFLL